MTVLVMRAIVNYFELTPFLAAAERYNGLREELGIPRYRVLAAAGGGHVNEVLFVAEFEDDRAVDAADETVSHADATREVLEEMYGHLVPGSVVERRFETLA